MHPTYCTNRDDEFVLELAVDTMSSCLPNQLSRDLHGEGCPVAVEVFEGNVGDLSALASQVNKLKERFVLKRVTPIGRSRSRWRRDQPLPNARALHRHHRG